MNPLLGTTVAPVPYAASSALQVHLRLDTFILVQIVSCQSIRFIFCPFLEMCSPLPVTSRVIALEMLLNTPVPLEFATVYTLCYVTSQYYLALPLIYCHHHVQYLYFSWA